MAKRRRVSDWVCVAAVAGAHGLRGALKLRCFTERPEDVAGYGPVFASNGERLFHLKVIGAARAGVLARAEGIDDRDAAEALRGVELFVPRSALPDLAPDEFYYSDLEGMDALGPDGSHLGVVHAVDNFGGGDLIEIRTDDGRLISLPFTREAVPTIDLAARRLVVEPPAEVTAEATP